jgi:hypothetical protein
MVGSEIAAARPEFIRLGLTDSALLHIAGDSHMLLTADVGLYIAALNDGKNAENFNHFRNIYSDSLKIWQKKACAWRLSGFEWRDDWRRLSE